jgi:hypothetical protein
MGKRYRDQCPRYQLLFLEPNHLLSLSGGGVLDQKLSIRSPKAATNIKDTDSELPDNENVLSWQVQADPLPKPFLRCQHSSHFHPRASETCPQSYCIQHRPHSVQHLSQLLLPLVSIALSLHKPNASKRHQASMTKMLRCGAPASANCAMSSGVQGVLARRTCILHTKRQVRQETTLKFR